jgi:hypothetical protein
VTPRWRCALMPLTACMGVTSAPNAEYFTQAALQSMRMYGTQIARFWAVLIRRAPGVGNGYWLWCEAPALGIAEQTWRV